MAWRCSWSWKVSVLGEETDRQAEVGEEPRWWEALTEAVKLMQRKVTDAVQLVSELTESVTLEQREKNDAVKLVQRNKTDSAKVTQNELTDAETLVQSEVRDAVKSMQEVGGRTKFCTERVARFSRIGEE